MLSLRIGSRASAGPQRDALRIALDVPGGVEHAWVGADPTRESLALLEVSQDRTRVDATWPAPLGGARDVWIVPRQPLGEVLRSLRIEVEAGAASRTVVAPAGHSDSSDGELAVRPGTLMRERTGSRGWTLGIGAMPLPLSLESSEGETPALSAADQEMIEELEAMGYLRR